MSSNMANVPESPTVRGSRLKPSCKLITDYRSTLLADNKLVKIFVGPQRQLFTLHEKRLCARVPYFKTLIDGEQSLDLFEDDPTVFAEFVDYVYSGQLECACSPGEEELRGENESQDVDPRIICPENEMTWCSLWVLANRLSCMELQHAALQRFGNCLYYHGTPASINAATITYVYENTQETSDLRTMIKDEFTHRYFTKYKSPVLRAQWAKDLGANDNFSAEILEHIEKHSKQVDRSFTWSYKCFVHNPLNPVQMILAKKRKANLEDQQHEAERDDHEPPRRRSRVDID